MGPVVPAETELSRSASQVPALRAFYADGLLFDYFEPAGSGTVPRIPCPSTTV